MASFIETGAIRQSPCVPEVAEPDLAHGPLHPEACAGFGSWPQGDYAKNSLLRGVPQKVSRSRLGTVRPIRQKDSGPCLCQTQVCECSAAVLFFQPLLRVALWILEQRGKNSDEGQLAREWLNTVTAESAFQLALVADATDETMVVNRYFDQDNFSKADITVQVSAAETEHKGELCRRATLH